MGSIGFIDYLRQLNKIKLYSNRDKKDAYIFGRLFIIHAPLIAIGYGFALPSNTQPLNNKLTGQIIAALFGCAIGNALSTIMYLPSKDKNLDLKPLSYSMVMLLTAILAYNYLK